jgi:hypothetical protein
MSGTASLHQLYAQTDLDNFLSYDPLDKQSIPSEYTSPFTCVFRRPTKFARFESEIPFDGTAALGETITIRIPRGQAHLLSNLSLELEWNTLLPTAIRPGVQCIESFQLDIGGQSVDQQFGEWLDVYTQLTHSGEELARIQELQDGKIIWDPSSPQSFKTRCYVKLPFYFCKHLGNAIPLVSLPSIDIIAYVKFRPYIMLGVNRNPNNFNEYKPVISVNDITEYIPSNTTGNNFPIGYVPLQSPQGPSPWYGSLNRPIFYIRGNNDSTVAENSRSYTLFPIINEESNGVGLILLSTVTGQPSECVNYTPSSSVIFTEQNYLVKMNRPWIRTEQTINNNVNEVFPTTLGTLVVHRPSDPPQIESVRVYGEFILLDTEDLTRFKKNQVYLIEQVAREEYISPSSFSLTVPLVYMCQYLIVTAQRYSTVGVSSDFFNYFEPVTPGASVPSPSTTLSSIALKFDDQLYGRRSKENIPADYYRCVTPYLVKARGGALQDPRLSLGGFALIPFSLFLNPRTYQPSGQFSFPYIKSSQLEVGLIDSDAEEDSLIRIYAAHYNFIEIGPDHVRLATD